MSVCPYAHPSVRMEQLGSHWTDIYEICYISILRESDEKIQVSLKSDKNNGYFALRPMYIYDSVSLRSSYNGTVSNKVCRENQSIHFMFNNFFPKIVPFMRKCRKKHCTATDKNVTRHMRFVCWITRAANAHSQYVTFIVFPWQ